MFVVAGSLIFAGQLRLGKEEKVWCIVTTYLLCIKVGDFKTQKIGWKNRFQHSYTSYNHNTLFTRNITFTATSFVSLCLLSIFLVSFLKEHSHKLTPHLFQIDVVLYFEPYWKQQNVAGTSFWCFIKVNEWAFQWKENKILQLTRSKFMPMALTS